MHNAARGSLAVGGLILVIGIVMYALGASAAGGAMDPSDNPVFEGKTGSFEVIENTGLSIYADEGVDCNSFTATITDSDGNTEEQTGWGDYFVKDNCDGEGDLDGYVYVGSFNAFADDGTYTIDASSKVYMADTWADLGEALGGGLMAACGGLPAIICGVCFLLIGGVLGISLKDKQNVQVVSQQPQQMGAPVMMTGGAPAMGAPAMGAPAMGVPEMGAPAPAPAANPEAMAYYQGLLTQGHDPASAQSYTQQHFPGFQL